MIKAASSITPSYHPIIRIFPMAMVTKNYIGRIKQACEAIGAEYILVVIDYFNRFLFTRWCLFASMQKTIIMILDYLVTIFRWLMVTYCDNGSQFAGHEVRRMFADYGVV